ncbi:MAG TPA: protein-disulfide reductase DsbD domain-containing protein [Kiloniellales bacterium]|nr:protein-disulfide reductase DsbD domain-containing protein [Kiloniellales bacterium]
MRRFSVIFAVLTTVWSLLGAGLWAAPAHAAAGPWVDQEQVRLRLISATDAVGEAERLDFGLQFEMQPGWKVYWRSPGQAGYPPSLETAGSSNLAAAAVEWPVPHRFSLFGLETFGYSDGVVLPLAVRPAQAGEPLALSAKVDYLTCREICIPREAELALVLPAGPAGAAPEAALIEEYRGLVPSDGAAHGLSLERVRLAGTLEEPILRLTARADPPFEAPDAIVEAPPGMTFGKPEVSLAEDGELAVLSLPGQVAEGVIEGKRLTVTLFDGSRALESEVVGRFAETGGPAAGGRSLLVILGLALVGGLILNLMPCVLPVLSIKLLSVVGHGGRERGAIRLGFLASAAGIVSAFLALAAALVGLKSAGLAIGWGIQFQQPLFLAAMALIVAFFAYNLFGLFEFRLPGSVADFATRASAGGSPQAGGEPSLLGHFLTGAFATLLATPCSAPFLGTAVGFALAHGPGEILLIFAVLGLGLALPYLAIAAAPGLAARLPRPGPWMVWLRRILGLALAATAVWLLSVLAAQIGAGPASLIGLLLLGLGPALWLGRSEGRRRIAGGALIGVFAIAALLPAGLAARDQGAPSAADTAAASDVWRPLELERIPALVASGKTVFVDVTADWCLTCQVNKRLVLERETVRERFAEAEVVLMRGDWTLPDPAITAYLESFGRYGIPFDAVYGPGLEEGEALPELLTIEAVTDALDRAASG